MASQSENYPSASIRADLIGQAQEKFKFKERVREFSGWVDNYNNTGELPAVLLENCHVDWAKAEPLEALKPDEKYPSRPEAQLSYLEKAMLSKGVQARAISARAAGLAPLLDAACLEDMRILVFARSNYVNQIKGRNKWDQAIKQAAKVVKLKGGWGSDPTVWEDLPGEIVTQEPDKNVVCLAFSTIPYGRADIKQGEAAWEEFQQKNVLTHKGIGFVNAVLEQTLGVRGNIKGKKWVTVGHSFMGSEILHKPQHELDQTHESFIALAPAIKGKDFALGNYRTLGLISTFGGGVPGFFKKPVEQALKVLVSSLTGKVESRVKRAHEAVAALAFERGTLDKGMSHGIQYLTKDQGPVEGRRWPTEKRLQVLLSSHDPLVHERVHGELLGFGLKDNQITNYGLGHYSWCQTQSKNLSEVQEAQAVRKKLLGWIKGM